MNFKWREQHRPVAVCMQMPRTHSMFCESESNSCSLEQLVSLAHEIHLKTLSRNILNYFDNDKAIIARQTHAMPFRVWHRSSSRQLFNWHTIVALGKLFHSSLSSLRAWKVSGPRPRDQDKRLTMKPTQSCIISQKIAREKRANQIEKRAVFPAQRVLNIEMDEMWIANIER